MTSIDASTDALFARYGGTFRWLVAVTVTIGAIAMGLASSIVNVAVPAVMGAFGVGLDQAQWMSNGFLAIMSVMMLLSAWIIDAFGQRKTYIGLFIVFSAGALISSTAQSIDAMTVGRLLQGAATGVGQPLGMYSISRVFPPERRGMAIGVYGLATVLAPTFGPVLGGVAIDSLSWRYLFLLPLPFCLPALLLSMIFMPSKSMSWPLPRFDWIGLALILTAVFTLLSALSNGQRWGWTSDTILLLFLSAVAASAAFVFWQTRAENPLLDVTLFADRRFAFSMLAGFIFGVGLFGSAYFIPVFVQTIQDYTATRAGLLLAPGGLVMMLFFPLAGRITDSIPAHIPIAAGLVIFATGFFLMSVIDIYTAFWALVLYTLINRVGLSLAIPSLSVSALRSVPPDKLAYGASSSTFFRNLGGSLGIALLTAFFQIRAGFHADALVATQTAANAATSSFLDGARESLRSLGLTEQEQIAAALNHLSSAIELEANVLSFQDTFLAISVVALLAAGPAGMIGHGRQKA